MMGVWYTTREVVKGALDSKETARNDAQVDRAIDAASRSIEGLLHRRFYPQLTTRYFDWPNDQYSRPWRLWLDSNELISVTTLVAGSTTITGGDYFLRRADGLDESPYTMIELDLDSNATFGAGTTHQRTIAITGLYGYTNVTAAAGALAEALDGTETGVDVTNSAVIGVGNIILCESERMIVTGKDQLTTGQTLQTPVGAGKSEVTIAVTTGSSFNLGEIITLDSEQMLVVNITGNNLTVMRAWNGSVLATHTGSTIYAPRTLTVERGTLGTTAATHLTATAVTVHIVPRLIEQLCVAEALSSLQQELSAYGRTVGSSENQIEATGKGLGDLRKQAKASYGRQQRMGAI